MTLHPSRRYLVSTPLNTDSVHLYFFNLFFQLFIVLCLVFNKTALFNIFFLYFYLFKNKLIPWLVNVVWVIRHQIFNKNVFAVWQIRRTERTLDTNIKNVVQIHKSCNSSFRTVYNQYFIVLDETIQQRDRNVSWSVLHNITSSSRPVWCLTVTRQ